jgi:phage terminase large subunit
LENQTPMINPKFLPWVNQARYKIAYGGRGSGKSWSIAEMLIEISRRACVRILCARELQNSIADSVIQLLEDRINALGYDKEFVVHKNRITNILTGSTFLFYGIKTNTTKVKSLEGVNICWVEEAENVSKESWDILIPTIRAEGSEIWISFNPKNILDDSYQRFIENPPSNSIITKVNYDQNPHFPETLRQEMEALKEKDYDLYLHIWEGEPVADSEHAIIKPSWIKAAIDAHKVLGFEASGNRTIGQDVADEGEDSNALCYTHGSIVLDIQEWRKGDTSYTAKRAFAYAEKKGARIIYDSIGVGAGVKAKLNELNEYRSDEIECHGFNAGGKVANPKAYYIAGKTNGDMFSNLKAQAWWTIRERFHNTYLAVVEGKSFPVDQMISLSSDCPMIDKLSAELSRPQVDYDNNGKVKVESKKDMKKRGIPSPNLADALIMSIANCQAPTAGVLF